MHERERLSLNYNKVPKDIAYLTKNEAELRRELVLAIESGEEAILQYNNEVKRLKREHFNNLKELEGCQDKLRSAENLLAKVMERQSLNDNGMATLFKINNISAALEYQDEADREKVFLMGTSEVDAQRKVTNQ